MSPGKFACVVMGEGSPQAVVIGTREEAEDTMRMIAAERKMMMRIEGRLDDYLRSGAWHVVTFPSDGGCEGTETRRLT